MTPLLAHSPTPSARFRIHRAVLIPFLVVVVLLLLVFTSSTQWMYHLQEEHLLHKTRTELANHFESLLRQDAREMEGFLRLLARDRHLAELFRQGRRDELLAATSELFARLESRHRITHFYFTSLDRHVFLRVHQPHRRGDRIDRWTTRRAQERGELAAGVELGPLGTLTQRVVIPWEVDGRRVGYLELGKEVLHALSELKGIMGLEYFTLVDKRLLKRADWEEGMTMLERQGSWDQFLRWVLVGATAPPPPALEPYVNNRFQEEAPPLLGGDGRKKAEHFHFLNFPVSHPEGGVLGRVAVAYRDVFLRDAVQRHLGLMAGSTLLVAIALAFFFNELLRRVERRLAWAEEQMEESRERLVMAQEVAHFGSLDWRLESGAVHGSAELLRILGYERNHAPLTLRRFLRSVAREDRHRAVEWVRSILWGAAPGYLEVWIRRPDGTERFVVAHAAGTYDQGGRPRRLILALHDLTERRLAEERFQSAANVFDRAISEAETHLRTLRHEQEELSRQALVDPLTALGNRRWFDDALVRLLARSRRTGQEFALLLMDLDHFKPVNDTLGHQVGDLVLQEVGRRMQHGVRETDLLFRVGGDEFAALLPDCCGGDYAQQVANRLVEEVSRPMLLEGHDCHISLSVGIALWPRHAQSPGQLKERADQALYWVKHHGRKGGRIFDETVGGHHVRHQSPP